MGERNKERKIKEQGKLKGNESKLSYGGSRGKIIQIMCFYLYF